MSKESNDKELENLYNIVKDRFGDRLTTKELGEVKKDLQTIAEATKALRAVKLGNGDAPLFVFKPYIGRK